MYRINRTKLPTTFLIILSYIGLCLTIWTNDGHAEEKSFHYSYYAFHRKEKPHTKQVVDVVLSIDKVHNATQAMHHCGQYVAKNASALDPNSKANCEKIAKQKGNEWELEAIALNDHAYQDNKGRWRCRTNKRSHDFYIAWRCIPKKE